MIISRIAVIFAASSLLAINPLPAAAVTGATIVVNNASDVSSPSYCTLRDAITAANTNAATGGCVAGTSGLDTITFDTSVFNSNTTISPVVQLPEITAPVVITGDAPWFSTGSLIKIQGQGSHVAQYGFFFAGGSAGSVLNRLLVGGWSVAIELAGGGVTVTNSRIGVDFSSDTPNANQQGIRISGSNGNVIGGVDSSGNSLGNVISSNSAQGIEVDRGSNNVIQGNRIGTDASGFGSLSNAIGISLVGISGNPGVSTNTLIGGTEPGQGNVISGNSTGLGQGIRIGPGVKSTKIIGNFIGVGANGTTSIPNVRGIDDEGGAGTTIGGAMPQGSNFIDYNSDGIFITPTTTTSSLTISGNVIGLDVTNAAAANGEGINFAHAPAKATIKGNLIASNGYGIDFDGTAPIASVKQNCITGNTTYGAYHAFGTSDVHGNWWGSASGPNPPGSGDPIFSSTTLLVAPWLTKPPSACLGWSPKSVSPKDQSFFGPKSMPTKFSWSKVPNAVNYEWNLWIDGSPSGGTQDVANPSVISGSVLDYGLYQWYLNVSNSYPVVWRTQWYTFYVTIQKSPKPGSVAKPNRSGEITFTWNAYPGASSYTWTVYGTSDCSGGSSASHSGLTTTSFTTGLLAAPAFSWTVQPNNGPVMPCWSFTEP